MTLVQEGPSSSADLAVEAQLLDCLQANLAVLADRHHGPGTHLALGATLRFRPTTGSGGLPTVEPDLAGHLADAGRLLGLTVTATWQQAGPARLADLSRRHGELYVVADAHDLPWTPYHGQRHLEHSFLVGSGPEGAAITDAYRNQTPWGAAEPGHWVVDWAALPVAGHVVALAPAATVPTATAAVDLADPAPYLAAYAGHTDRVAALHRLTLETWLLARSRKLHAAFRARAGIATTDAVEEHLREWDLLTEQTYLAARRVERGRREPSGLLDRLGSALAADRAVFAVEASPDAVRDTVAGIVAAVLGTKVERVLAEPELPRLPGFDSVRLVEVVARLEDQLDVEFDPDDLLPENLHHLDGLCRLVTGAAGAAGGAR
ncbi:phosphopantetheine-binding protein [Amycolatopsis sp. OK19-0408]|uniref:Phosphopantetheine-binding protein n=1 Tax=Amycolatopsis iheyensis TaxID=2945988 RepID=A0A9X2SI87_9PSEU|nr:phosphopantetheine-binding protein [Amycolatopsis iheyensis]MCR6483502.1 phosphopantetheine-binding protein [Amycolatopsis iheyensis]